VGFVLYHGWNLIQVPPECKLHALPLEPVLSFIAQIVYLCCSEVKRNVLFVAAVIILMPGLHGVLIVGVPLYSVLLMTMVWRATARVQFFEVSITVHLEAVKWLVQAILLCESVELPFFTCESALRLVHTLIQSILQIDEFFLSSRI
jgi:uncharacterized membrane protein YhhN